MEKGMGERERGRKEKEGGTLVFNINPLVIKSPWAPPTSAERHRSAMKCAGVISNSQRARD